MWQGISLRRREESSDESGAAVNTHTINKSNNQEGHLELEIEKEESEMSKKGCCSSSSSGQDQSFIQKHLQQIQPEMILSDISTTALSSQHQSLQQKVLFLLNNFFSLKKKIWKFVSFLLFFK